MSEGIIRLSWEKPAIGSESDIDEYRVYRDLDPIPDDDPNDTEAELIGRVRMPEGDPETAFIDSEVTRGTTYYYRVTTEPEDGDESDFSNQASATTPPAVIITAPTVPAPDPQAANTSISLAATLSSDIGINSAQLHFRQGGASTFEQTTQQLSGTDIDFEETIDASTVTARGIDFFLTATDGDDRTTRAPESGYYSIPVETSGLSTQHSGGTAQTAFRMISFPLNLSDPRFSRILEDDLGPLDPKQWRLFEISPDGLETGGYVEIQNLISSAFPGDAFWLITRNDATIDTGQGVSLRTNELFSIELQAGWNLIGNPFAFDLPLSNITVANSTAALNDVLRYNGQFVPLDTSDALTPFEGYLVRLSDGGSGTLQLNPDVSEPSSTSSALTAAPFDWQIDIGARVQQARDTYNTVAVAPGAQLTYDDLDRFEPPPIGQYVSLYFPHDDWGTHRGPYRRDVRPATRPLHSWTFEVRTNVSDRVTLTFNGVHQLPTPLSAWLVDEELGVTRDLRSNPQYHFSARPPDAPASFRLIIGPKAAVQRALDQKTARPQHVELFPNFPNPFSSSTTIHYALPEAMPVTLRVFDTLGREVVTLRDAKPTVSGHHTVVWGGHRANGQVVASGTYLYRLTAGDTIKTGRMVLVR